MQLYTVWGVQHCKDIEAAKRDHLVRGIAEKCLINNEEDYVGQKTGNIYPRESHYHSEQLEGRIVAIDDENLTGMLHLNEEWSDGSKENAKSFKEKYLGCKVTLEVAHFADGLRIYRCLELDNEYFSENEIEIINSSKYIFIER